MFLRVPSTITLVQVYVVEVNSVKRLYLSLLETSTIRQSGVVLCANDIILQYS